MPRKAAIPASASLLASQKPLTICSRASRGAEEAIPSSARESSSERSPAVCSSGNSA